ncbi:LOW QUALITY PROTEIN: protein FAM234B [Phycodurus eques]|uniref:LOW QUALITY PROTEIN: protein FAM234B n=1 Tax=Phycodurus eques TaxID=693459 RepID=UPI002ACD94DA|nr:LOW QUALITY PROTEIN: protein FAM234B [Phycodurus eques]
MDATHSNSRDATGHALIQAHRGRTVAPPGSSSSSPLCCRSARTEMAAALSRALKLPGKKGSELGEYDPLTQADSEDESEEDDLVLNYPRNGLGRDTFHGGVTTKLRGGRAGRLVAAGDEAQDDEDEWRERLPSKSQQDRDDMKGGQYWSPLREDRDQLGGSRLRVHGTDEEEKRMRRKNAVRTSLFLVPLVCAMLLVLLCAFLIPCQKGALAKRPQWEIALGDAGGVIPPALALWDVDGDSVDDVLLSVTEWTNDTHPTQGNEIYSAVVLSGATGQLLWRKAMWESVMYIQCGLQLSTKPLPVCLLIGKSIIMAVNGTTGKNLWSVLLRNIESQAVLLPDLQGDSVPDLLIATLPANEALDLSLTLISGLTGATLGQSVSFNLTGQGNLIGPLLHVTQQGAPYILFGLGNVVAISLRDLYICATSKLPMTPTLRRKDPLWEGLKKTNSSSFIHIFRGSERVTFLLPLVAGFGTCHNNLDTVSNMNSSKSDWLLVYGSSKISVLRHRDVRKQWTFNSAPIHSQPTPGHFNDDGILDLFFQHSANGIMKAQVIDGANGRPLWTAQFVCPRLVLETAAVSTSTGLSAFVFWASEPITGQKNITKATVALGVAAAEPFIRKLFLLHPAYPTILLELASTTDTAVAAAVSYEERQKDASYITVSSRPTPDSKPAAHIVKNMRLRAAIAKGQMVTLGERNKTGTTLKPDMFELDKFYRHLFFKHQVRESKSFQ